MSSRLLLLRHMSVRHCAAVAATLMLSPLRRYTATKAPLHIDIALFWATAAPAHTRHIAADAASLPPLAISPIIAYSFIERC